MGDPRKLSLVTLKDDIRMGLADADPDSSFFKELQTRGNKQIPVLVYMGEIPNMTGHVVVVGNVTGKIFSGYHVDLFRELTDEEV